MPSYLGNHWYAEQAVCCGYAVRAVGTQVIRGGHLGTGSTGSDADRLSSVVFIVWRRVDEQCRSGYDFGGEKRICEADIAMNNGKMGNEKSEVRYVHFENGRMR